MTDLHEQDNTMDFIERMRARTPTILTTWDVECPLGWEKLVEQLLIELETHAVETNLDLRVEQIKPKFGGLRCYVTGEDERTVELIRKAEVQSMSVCEVCGLPGRAMGRGWISTLCPAHGHRV